MYLGGALGQYRITGLLGTGGMGTVYAAEHTVLGRPAAVKVLLPELSQDPQIVTRFFNEARAATAVRHPGIIEIFDFGWHTDGAGYLVMERLEGESLNARISRAPMSWSRALAIVRQIAGVLAATHAKGIIHRDLKPDNVFLEPDPEVPGGERIKLLDFGIAKIVGDSGSPQTTRTGAVMGTPSYMAPEQCRGVTVDHRADLYAVGCILFKLCTGRVPFVGTDTDDVLAAHIHMPVPAMASLRPGIPVEVERLAQRLLAKHLRDRVQTADELIRDIDAVMLSVGPGEAHVGGLYAAHVISPGTPPGLAGTTQVEHGRLVHRLSLAAAAALLAGSIVYLLARDAESSAVRPSRGEPAPGSAAPATRAAEESPPPAPLAPSLQTVELVIDSAPAGADVVVSGELVGKTPLRGTLPRGERDVPVVVRLRGYEEAILTVRPVQPIMRQIQLAASLQSRPPPQTAQPVRDPLKHFVNPFRREK